MNNLRVFDYNGVDVVDSREVAQMVEKSHAHLLRDIAGYIKIMEESNESTFGLVGNKLNFQPVNFFIPSTYQDSKGETRPCYLITKKGYDMVANKLNGEKGVLFTAVYVTAFEDMHKALTAPPVRVALPEGVSLTGLAKMLTVTRRIMLDMGNSPVEIGAVANGLCEACGVPLHKAFSCQIPGQMCLFDRTEGTPLLPAGLKIST